MTRGLRKVPARKPPKRRPGLDDPAHKRFVRSLRCVLAGRTCQLTRWVGVHPNKQQVTETYRHVCVYEGGQSDPHHTTKKSQRGHDHTVVPLCRAAHEEAERLTNAQFKARWGIALPVIASQLVPTTERMP